MIAVLAILNIVSIGLAARDDQTGDCIKQGKRIKTMSNVYPTDIYFGEHRVDQTEGISLREYFAIQCLQPLIHNSTDSTYRILVKKAVQIADMLIEELKNENTTD